MPFPPAARFDIANEADGYCAAPTCRRRLSIPNGVRRSLGEAAHIESLRADGPRPAEDVEERLEYLNSVENGLWLCPTCHTRIDRLWQVYGVDMLQRWKQDARRYADDALAGYASEIRIDPRRERNAAEKFFEQFYVPLMRADSWFWPLEPRERKKTLPDDTKEKLAQIYFQMKSWPRRGDEDQVCDSEIWKARQYDFFQHIKVAYELILQGDHTGRGRPVDFGTDRTVAADQAGESERSKEPLFRDPAAQVLAALHHGFFDYREELAPPPPFRF